MIVVDGYFYQFTGDGTLRQSGDTDPVPFAVVTFFEPDKQLSVSGSLDYDSLRTLIEKKLPSRNMGYAIKIEGDFAYLKCGSIDIQEKPYTKTLSQALVNRPVFEKEDISGTMVGFWYPEYMENVNVPGFHLHCISGDHEIAGHVLEFEASDLEISIDICPGFDVELPETDDFSDAVFDLKQGYY
jgi:acetolactate decarboxylase